MLILDVKTRWASTHQMLRTPFQLFIHHFQAHRCQVEHLTIAKLLTPLYQETRTSMPSNSAILTGSPSNLWLHGWKPFDLQLQKCLPQKYQCFQQHTRFFEAYKMTSRIFSTIFPTRHHRKSNLVSPMPTASWVTITTSLTHLPSTYGLHVRRFFSNQLLTDLIMLLVLDPRISYEGIKTEYADDLMLSDHLEQSKSMLFDYFNENYANIILVPSSSPSTSIQSPPTTAGSPQKSFTARYRRKEKTSVNELEEYFKLPAEDFDACNPIHWWFGRRAQFPNLFCMARNILCIPGELSVSYRSLFQTYLQVLLSPLRGSSQVVATQSPSGMLVFILTPFTFSCLSRSGCTLLMPKLMPPCIVEQPECKPLLFSLY